MGGVDWLGAVDCSAGPRNVARVSREDLTHAGTRT